MYKEINIIISKMNLIFMTLALSAFGNATNQTHVNHTYQVALQQFNTSNCTVPFYNFSFLFNCTEEYNQSDCCLEEYNKLNTSYGSMQCNQYEMNDTYLTFDCQLYSKSNSKNTKTNPYIVAGIAVGSALLLILVISSCIVCLRRCSRSRYNRI